MKFEMLDHAADIKFKIYGTTLNEIFENSALALTSYITNNAKLKSTRGKVIDVSGNDTESLLYKFIDELIYLFDTENFISTKAEITLRGNNLHAELYGCDATNYEVDHVKAATYSEMYIHKTKKGWEAQIVIDV